LERHVVAGGEQSLQHGHAHLANAQHANLHAAPRPR
jgi:hypothetical protein